MRGEWISFPGLLCCWTACMLLPPLLAWLWKFDPRRPGSLLPVILAPLCLWLRQPLMSLAQQGEVALLHSPIAAFVNRSFDLLLS